MFRIQTESTDELATLIEKSAYDSNKTHLEPKNAILFARNNISQHLKDIFTIFFRLSCDEKVHIQCRSCEKT
jgi:hypothetical protein